MQIVQVLWGDWVHQSLRGEDCALLKPISPRRRNAAIDGFSKAWVRI